MIYRFSTIGPGATAEPQALCWGTAAAVAGVGSPRDGLHRSRLGGWVAMGYGIWDIWEAWNSKCLIVIYIYISLYIYIHIIIYIYIYIYIYAIISSYDERLSSLWWTLGWPRVPVIGVVESSRPTLRERSWKLQPPPASWCEQHSSRRLFAIRPGLSVSESPELVGKVSGPPVDSCLLVKKSPRNYR